MQHWIETHFKVARKNGNEWAVYCPCHDDKNPSASINIDKGVINCQKCGGLSLYSIAKGMNWDLPPQTGTNAGKPRELARYDYRDEKGRVIYQIVKLMQADGKKRFMAYNPVNNSYKLEGVQRYPYRLPELIQGIEDRHHVFICEGEKDCETLAKMGLVATTNTFGARSTKIWEDHARYFSQGVTVYICPDADVVGKKHAETIKAILTARGCSVKVLDFGYPVLENHGKDVTDWFEDGHTHEDLVNLLSDTTADDDDHVADEEGSANDDKDYGHAVALLPYYHNRFRYACHRSTWMEYNGIVWRDIDDNRMAKLSADWLKRHYLELQNRAVQANDKGLSNHYSRCIKDAQTYCRIIGALSFLKGWEGVRTLFEEWDRDPWLYNVKNGTIDLRDGSFHDHDPDQLITKASPVDYNPKADTELWTSHLERFLPCPAVRREVQRNLGVSLCAAQLTEIFPIWYGTGGNGKTTTIKVLQHVMGNYTMKAVADLLVASKFDKHPTELADLCGARAVFSIEIDKEKKLAEARVKELTGGDSVKARYMRCDFFQFEKTWTIFLIVNHKPVIMGTDPGIWRRIRLIPWTVRISDKEKLPQDQVIEALKGESSAVLNWLLEGLRDFMSDNAWIAEEVRAATAEYQHEQDRMGGFFDECCVLRRDLSVQSSELYERYCDYCRGSGDFPLKQKTFNKILKEHDLTTEKTREYNIWRGIALKSAEGVEGSSINGNSCFHVGLSGEPSTPSAKPESSIVSENPLFSFDVENSCNSDEKEPDFDIF